MIETINWRRVKQSINLSHVRERRISHTGHASETSRRDRSWPFNGLDMSSNLGEDNILSLATWCFLAHEEEVQWESHVKGICVVDLLDVFVGQLQREGGNIALQVLYLTTSDNREDVRGLVENISQSVDDVSGCLLEYISSFVNLRNRRQDCVLSFGNLFQNLADGNVHFCSHAQVATIGGLSLLFSFEATATQHTPRSDSHAFSFTHGNDLAFKVSVRSAPAALVDNEWTEAVVACVLVGLGDDPGWRVGYAKVQYLALVGEGV